jgi:hypothetical protein
MIRIATHRPLMLAFASGILAAIVFAAGISLGQVLPTLVLYVVCLIGWLIATYFGFIRSVSNGFLCMLAFVLAAIPPALLAYVLAACARASVCL